jgi:hypothetical protein
MPYLGRCPCFTFDSTGSSSIINRIANTLLHDVLPRQTHWHNTFMGTKQKVLKFFSVPQVYIGRGRIETFSLVADMTYIGDNCARLARAILEIALWNKWTEVIEKMLTVRLHTTCQTCIHVEIAVVSFYRNLLVPLFVVMTLDSGCQ